MLEQHFLNRAMPHASCWTRWQAEARVPRQAEVWAQALTLSGNTTGDLHGSRPWELPCQGTRLILLQRLLNVQNTGICQAVSSGYLGHAQPQARQIKSSRQQKFLKREMFLKCLKQILSWLLMTQITRINISQCSPVFWAFISSSSFENTLSGRHPPSFQIYKWFLVISWGIS